MKFVFDLDGTICFKGQPVSEKILAALDELTAFGHEVIFASARPIRDLLPVLDIRLHSYPMIGGNGAIIADQGKLLSTVHFDEATLSKLCRLLEHYRVTYLADGSWDYAYTGPVDHPILRNLDPHKLAQNISVDRLGPVIKLLMLTSDQMDKVKEELNSLDVVVNVHGDEGVLDVSPNGINKWAGLKRLGVKDREYVAFGNDANDISMFQHAKHSVMIGDNSLLKPFATEQIQLEDELEASIVARIIQLGRNNEMN